MPKRRTGFVGVLWDNFLVVHGPTLGIAGLGVGIVAWRFGAKSEVSVPFWVLTSVVVFGLIIGLTLCQALISTLRQLTGFESLRVIKVIPKPPWQECLLGFVVEPQANVEQGNSVLFIHYKDRFERHIGSGAVRWCQEDGCVQVSLDELYVEEKDAFLASLKQGQAEAMNELQIRIGHVPRVERFASKAGAKAVVPSDERNEESES